MLFLQELNLSSNNMGASTIAELVLAHMPMLTELCLMHNKLDQPAIAQLVRGRWFNLAQLQLQSNDLDDYAMLTLLAGYWLGLRKLSLHHNKFTGIAAAHLVYAPWPGLLYLSLDETALPYNASRAFCLIRKSRWTTSKGCYLAPLRRIRHWPNMSHMVIVRQPQGPLAKIWEYLVPGLRLGTLAASYVMGQLTYAMTQEVLILLADLSQHDV